MFLHVQSIYTSRMNSPFFSKCVSFLLSVHHSFFKLKRILTLMIRRAITHLNTFGSKVFLTLKNMDFRDIVLTKLIPIYIIKGMNA